MVSPIHIYRRGTLNGRDRLRVCVCVCACACPHAHTIPPVPLLITAINTYPTVLANSSPSSHLAVPLLHPNRHYLSSQLPREPTQGLSMIEGAKGKGDRDRFIWSWLFNTVLGPGFCDSALIFYKRPSLPESFHSKLSF